jgi:hypothetical protein
MQIRGDDPEAQAQVEHVPDIAPEHAHRRRASAGRERPVLVRQQVHEHRLAGAVGSENRRVLARVNRQRQAVEDPPVPFHDGCIVQLEDGRVRQR